MLNYDPQRHLLGVIDPATLIDFNFESNSGENLEDATRRQYLAQALTNQVLIIKALQAARAVKEVGSYSAEQKVLKQQEEQEHASGRHGGYEEQQAKFKKL